MNDKILESYKKFVFEKYGSLSFTPYPAAQGRIPGSLLEVPLKDIFLPFDFSIYSIGAKENHTIRFPEMMESLEDRVILGGPGCGKTTFLKYTLINRINKNIIPVFWEWRDFHRLVKKDNDLNSILASYLKRILENKPSEKAIQAFIRQYNFVFLIDGIDEVASKSRLPIIKSLIQSHKEKYHGSYFILSSRLANYPGEYLNLFSGIGFQHYKINPLNEHLISQYINRFIGLMVPDDEIKRSDKIEFLSKYIKSKPGVRQLAGHPLLLNLMVLIYLYEGTLPDTKVNLYNRCIEVLIYVWKRSPLDIETFNRLHLDNTALFGLLSQTAFEYFEKYLDGKAEEYGVLPGIELKNTLKRVYKTLVRRVDDKDKINDAVKKLFKYFKDKTGIIVEVSANHFGFSHLTLFEYLAASHIAMKWADFKNNIELIIRVLKNPRFEAIAEVIIFQVEILGKSTSGVRFIDILAPRLLAIYKENKIYNILILLARLLIENQDFSRRDTKDILNLILIYWANHPGDNEVTGLINNILLMSENSRTYLVKYLGQAKKEKEIWENVTMTTAHRIGEKVFGIRGGLTILEKEIEKIDRIANSEQVEEKLKIVRDQLESLNIIIEQYREFSTEIKINLQESPIDSLMVEIRETLKKSYPDIEIDYFPSGKNQAVVTDKSRIAQIIKELVKNSIQHAGVEDVKISLSVECLGNSFLIHSNDNGRGIPERIKEKIFEPFFSTSDKNTGLGLAYVKKIIETLDGEVEELGSENQGAHFVVTFNYRRGDRYV